eukprot:1158150-Pelagomonas_calceolata.AAC.5
MQELLAGAPCALEGHITTHASIIPGAPSALEGQNATRASVILSCEGVIAMVGRALLQGPLVLKHHVL